MFSIYQKRIRRDAGFKTRKSCGSGDDPGGAAIQVLVSINVVLVEVTEGDFKECRSFFAAGDTVHTVTRAEEIVPLLRLVFDITNANYARALKHVPEFVTMLMGLQTDRMTSLHANDLHGRELIQGEALKATPRALLFEVV